MDTADNTITDTERQLQAHLPIYNFFIYLCFDGTEHQSIYVNEDYSQYNIIACSTHIYIFRNISVNTT